MLSPYIHSCPCSGPCKVRAMLISSEGDILLLFDYFHTAMSAGVSPIPNFGLDLKPPGLLMACHQTEKV